MSLTLTFNHLSNPPSMAIDLVGTPPPGDYTGYRTDANGTRELPRLQANAGKTRWFDYELALTPGPVSYTLTDGTWEHTGVLMIPAGLVPTPVIQAVTEPTLQFAVPHLTPRYSAAQDTTSTVHYPIQRQSPLVIAGPARLRSGTLEAWCATLADAQQLGEVLEDAGGAMLVRSPDLVGLDMYFSSLNFEVSPADQAAAGWRWLARIDFVEVDYPLDAPTVPRTFSDLLPYGTFLALATQSRDFAQVYSGAAE